MGYFGGFMGKWVLAYIIGLGWVWVIPTSLNGCKWVIDFLIPKPTHLPPYCQSKGKGTGTITD